MFIKTAEYALLALFSLATACQIDVSGRVYDSNPDSGI